MRGCVCTCVRVCVSACECACVRACVRVSIERTAFVSDGGWWCAAGAIEPVSVDGAPA